MADKLILQKYIALSGYCSRRKAEELIRKKLVKVNGRAAELGMQAGPDDRVEIRGKMIRLGSERIYIALNKPKGYTSTARSFKAEKNIFELLKGSGLPLGKLKIAGRLDKDSRGLLILTNDGDFVYKLTHPKFGHEKEYIAEIRNENLEVRSTKSEVRNKEIIKKLKLGVDIGEGDGIAKAKDAKFLGGNKFKIILTEGKKRQIRRMFKALGLVVADLQRVRIDKYKLEDLGEGKWRKLEIRIKN